MSGVDLPNLGRHLELFKFGCLHWVLVFSKLLLITCSAAVSSALCALQYRKPQYSWLLAVILTSWCCTGRVRWEFSCCLMSFFSVLNFRRAHTLTVLFILTCALGYVTLLEETPQDTAYNTKRWISQEYLNIPRCVLEKGPPVTPVLPCGSGCSLRKLQNQS